MLFPRTLFQIAAPPAKSIAVATVCLLLETAVSLSIPLIGGHFGELALTEQANPNYHPLLLIWLLLMLTQQGLRFFSTYIMGSAGAQATARLRNRIYDHLQALPLSDHLTRDRGDTLTLLSRDAGILGQFFTTTLPTLAPQLLLLVGAWVMMFSLSPTLGLIIGLAAPLSVVGLKLLSRHIRPLAAQLAQAHADHLGAAEENLRVLNILKAFGRESAESERLTDQSHHIMHLERRHLLLMTAIGPLVQAVGAGLLILVLWLGANQLTQGELEPGAAISLLLYGLMLFRPASLLAGIAGNLQSTLGASTRIWNALSTETEDFLNGRQLLPNNPGAIRFENLRFSYPGREEIFGGLNYDIHPGEIIAITGANGSGKTTLINLLMRFLEPASGRILIDGVDSRAFRLDALRSAIGLVPQEVTLLHGTIRENIAYGLPSASEESIRKAADAAQATPFIDNMPLGMDTLLGPEGKKLSGGQAQRIALARALLRNCPILIFDEATSMLDHAGENTFAKELRALTSGRTVLLVSHRPGTSSIADRELCLPPPTAA